MARTDDLAVASGIGPMGLRLRLVVATLGWPGAAMTAAAGVGRLTLGWIGVLRASESIKKDTHQL